MKIELQNEKKSKIQINEKCNNIRTQLLTNENKLQFFENQFANILLELQIFEEEFDIIEETVVDESTEAQIITQINRIKEKLMPHLKLADENSKMNQKILNYLTEKDELITNLDLIIASFNQLKNCLDNKSDIKQSVNEIEYELSSTVDLIKSKRKPIEEEIMNLDMSSIENSIINEIMKINTSTEYKERTIKIVKKYCKIYKQNCEKSNTILIEKNIDLKSSLLEAKDKIKSKFSSPQHLNAKIINKSRTIELLKEINTLKDKLLLNHEKYINRIKIDKQRIEELNYENERLIGENKEIRNEIEVKLTMKEIKESFESEIKKLKIEKEELTKIRAEDEINLRNLADELYRTKMENNGLKYEVMSIKNEDVIKLKKENDELTKEISSIYQMLENQSNDMTKIEEYYNKLKEMRQRSELVVLENNELKEIISHYKREKINLNSAILLLYKPKNITLKSVKMDLVPIVINKPKRIVRRNTSRIKYPIIKKKNVKRSNTTHIPRNSTSIFSKYRSPQKINTSKSLNMPNNLNSAKKLQTSKSLNVSLFKNSAKTKYDSKSFKTPQKSKDSLLYNPNRSVSVLK